MTAQRCCGCDGSGDGDLADLSNAKRCPRGPDVKEVKKTGRCGGAVGPVDSGTAQISSAPIALYATSRRLLRTNQLVILATLMRKDDYGTITSHVENKASG